MGMALDIIQDGRWPQRRCKTGAGPSCTSMLTPMSTRWLWERSSVRCRMPPPAAVTVHPTRLVHTLVGVKDVSNRVRRCQLHVLGQRERASISLRTSASVLCMPFCPSSQHCLGHTMAVRPAMAGAVAAVEALLLAGRTTITDPWSRGSRNWAHRRTAML